MEHSVQQGHCITSELTQPAAEQKFSCIAGKGVAEGANTDRMTSS